MTQSQQGTSEALNDTPSWALGLAILLFAYATVGGAVAVWWLIDLATRLVNGPPPSKPFITAANVNLLFVPVALIGGALALGYYRAAESDDPERAAADSMRLQRWAWTAVAVLIAFLVCMFVAAVLTGEFPG